METTTAITELTFKKPALITRIKSTFADTCVIIILMLIASSILNNIEIESGVVRGATLVLIFLYEPIMTSVGQTLGQLMMGLRVRQAESINSENSPKNINIFASIIRYITKLLLGWISLVTIHSNTYGQAIHDQVASSVMVEQ